MMRIGNFCAAILALLSPAVAMAEAGGEAGINPIGQIIFFAGFILIFYFLIWRPQSKRAKEHKNLVGGLDKGDEVVTGGGLTGRITKVTDNFVVVEIADNVEVKIQKSAVASALPKGTLKDI